MEFFVPKYRRDPNEKVESLYYGVGPCGTVVTNLVTKSRDADAMMSTKTYETGLARGEGGQAAVIILGGMETTLDEMEDILEAKRQEKFVPRRSGKEIADMCRLLLEQRNDRIRYYQKNPSEAPKRKTVRLHLPVGFRYVDTSEPGLKILARI